MSLGQKRILTLVFDDVPEVGIPTLPGKDCALSPSGLLRDDIVHVDVGLLERLLRYWWWSVELKLAEKRVYLLRGMLWKFSWGHQVTRIERCLHSVVKLYLDHLVTPLWQMSPFPNEVGTNVPFDGLKFEGPRKPGSSLTTAQTTKYDYMYGIHGISLQAWMRQQGELRGTKKSDQPPKRSPLLSLSKTGDGA
ncbi:hypothetical protein LZ30DRAFT_694857 [Colletotrichum cereale]|nr:hypothetical protein LZ30DRAFT_694857 [Colletotrichum cereale]